MVTPEAPVESLVAWWAKGGLRVWDPLEGPILHKRYFLRFNIPDFEGGIWASAAFIDATRHILLWKPGKKLGLFISYVFNLELLRLVSLMRL